VALGQLPHSQVLAVQPPALRQECLLAGGDDYELLFCAPPARRAAVLQAAAAAQVPVQCVGHITTEPGLQVLDEAGQPLDLGRLQAFDHFKS
jgi:thiamine-monophosphate kinase